MSNSKLNEGQKANRKAWLARLTELEGTVHSFPDVGVTVALLPTGEYMGKFSVSIASPDEEKFRRKVGEHFALYRMFASGEAVPMVLDSWDDREMVAGRIANAVAGSM